MTHSVLHRKRKELFVNFKNIVRLCINFQFRTTFILLYDGIENDSIGVETFVSFYCILNVFVLSFLS